MKLRFFLKSCMWEFYVVWKVRYQLVSLIFTLENMFRFSVHTNVLRFFFYFLVYNKQQQFFEFFLFGKFVRNCFMMIYNRKCWIHFSTSMRHDWIYAFVRLCIAKYLNMYCILVETLLVWDLQRWHSIWTKALLF